MMKRAVLSFLVCAGLVAGCSCDEPQTNVQATVFEVQPKSLEFGDTVVGAEGTRTFEVHNRSSTSIAIEVASNEALFEVQPASASAMPNASTTFTVTFSPEVIGPAEGTITVVIGSDTEEVALSGNGIAATVAVIPADGIDFGDVPRDRKDTGRDDRPAPTQTVAVRNAGSAPFEVIGVALIDDGGGAFSVDLDGLLGSYDVSEQRSGEVTFDPDALGTVEGALKITTSDPVRPEIVVPLRGFGYAAVLVACSGTEGQEQEVCTPELPSPGAPEPGWTFGSFLDLEGNRGWLRIRNEGNWPLELRKVENPIASPDFTWSLDEEGLEPVAFGTFAPVICPADVEDERCTHQEEFTLWVDYRARGTFCCEEGVQECVDVAPAGDCTQLKNSDIASVVTTTNDRLFSSFQVVATGSSKIPLATIDETANADLNMGGTVNISVSNDGEQTLHVLDLFLSDPADVDCTEGPPCPCSTSTSVTCAVFRLDPSLQVPFSLEPGEEERVQLTFSDPNPGPHTLDAWWTTNDPTGRRSRSRIVVMGLGRPE